MDVLKNLKLDHWYMVLMAVGAIVFVLAITVKLQVPNAPLALIACGAFFIGMGEWRNHPLRVRLEERMGVTMKISGNHRSPCLLGTLFDLLGGLLAAVGTWQLTTGQQIAC